MSGAITNKKGRVPPSFYYLLLIAATVTAGSLGGYFGRNQLLLILAKARKDLFSLFLKPNPHKSLLPKPPPTDDDKIEETSHDGQQQQQTQSNTTDPLPLVISTGDETALASLSSLPPYPPHTHTPALQTAISILKQVYPLKNNSSNNSSTTTWTLQQTRDTIAISTAPLSSLPIPMVRGDTFIPTTSSAFSIEEWFSVIKSPVARRVWDQRFDSAIALEYPSPDENVTHSTQKGTFPVAARDFVSLNTILHPPPSSTTDSASWYISTSIPSGHPLAPPPGSNGRVRGDLKVAAWRLCPGSKDSIDGLFVTYLVGVDIKGTVPQALIKAVQTQTPLCINEVHKYLKSFGPLPFILKSSLGPTHPLSLSSDISNLRETYETATHTFSATFTSTIPPSPSSPSTQDGEDRSSKCIKLGRICFALPRRIFATGAMVTARCIDPVTGTDLLGVNGKGIVVVDASICNTKDHPDFSNGNGNKWVSPAACSAVVKLVFIVKNVYESDDAALVLVSSQDTTTSLLMPGSPYRSSTHFSSSSSSTDTTPHGAKSTSLSSSKTSTPRAANTATIITNPSSTSTTTTASVHDSDDEDEEGVVIGSHREDSTSSSLSAEFSSGSSLLSFKSSALVSPGNIVEISVAVAPHSSWAINGRELVLEGS